MLPDILRAVADAGYTEPTPIQAKAIPVVLEGRDIMGGAQTGTGKTAAFTLPLLQKLAPFANTSVSPARHPVRALVLCPTRELAAQVEDSVRTYGKYLPLRSAAVFGGVDINPQIKALHGGVEVLVATPGRLLDHMHQRTVKLGQVQYLVLDEADRMLDMGFLPDIKRILAALPPVRQNLLFSATFDEEIRRLADGLLNAPVLVEVARRNAVTELVTHIAHPVDTDHKRDALAHLIRSQDMHQVLVFVRTKQGADRLARALTREGIECAAIHSDKTQQQRMQVLQDFKDNKVTALVATDIAARGLDIEQLPHVINYEMPNSPEDYVHRSGRTGRAGATGHAVSLVAPEERQQLADIEKLIKRKIDQQPIPGFEPAARRRAARSGEERAPRREEARPARREPASVTPLPEAREAVYPRRPPSTEPPMRPALGGASRATEKGPSEHHPRRRASKPVPALLGGGTRERSES